MVAWECALLPRKGPVLTRLISESEKHQTLATVAVVGSSVWLLLVLPKISNRLMFPEAVCISWKKLPMS